MEDESTDLEYALGVGATRRVAPTCQIVPTDPRLVLPRRLLGNSKLGDWPDRRQTWMKYDRVRQHRRSIRLTEYDYARAGAYFVTICTNNRESQLGEMADSAVLLNAYGKVAVDERLRTAVVRQNVWLDAFVVMPNHLHGIIIVTHDNADLSTVRRGDPAGRPYTTNHAHRPASGSVGAIVGQFKAGRPYIPNRAHGPSPGSVGAIIGQFKARATKRINVLRRTPGASGWQRNYYEHVIRDEGELNQIRQYVADNPTAWETDENNPSRHMEPAAMENRRGYGH